MEIFDVNFDVLKNQIFMDYQSLINKLRSVMQQYDLLSNQIEEFMENAGRSHNVEMSKDSANEHSDENSNRFESCYMEKSTKHEEKKNDDDFENCHSFILEIQSNINDIKSNIQNIIL